MDGQCHYDVRPTPGNLADRAADRFEVVAPALAAVCRHENQPTAVELGFFNSSSIQDGWVGAQSSCSASITVFPVTGHFSTAKPARCRLDCAWGVGGSKISETASMIWRLASSGKG